MFLKFRKFHKISYSYYPSIFGVGVFGVVFCLSLFMNMGLFYPFITCVFYVFYVSVLWVKDVVLEDVSGQYSINDCRMFGQGFRLFLFSELALFFSIF